MQYPVTIVDLLRHGECEGGHRYRGSIDVSLTPKGYQQMQNSVDMVDEKMNAQWQVVASSPMIRCQQFAHDFAQKKSIPLDVEPQLKEMSFGDWEGQEIDTVWKEQQAQADAWARDPVNNPPPNGEAADVSLQRVTAGWKNVLENHTGKRVLCVVHGGVIRMILAHIFDMPITSIHCIDVPFACISRIEITHTEEKNFYRLIAHNII